MPMIDMYFPKDLFDTNDHSELGRELTLAVLRAEGVSSPTATHLNNTAAFLHPIEHSCVNTAARPADQVIRVEVLTPPAALSREAQKRPVSEITQLVCRLCTAPNLEGRTWVLLKEAAEGGWGIAGTAFGREEFARLARPS